MELSYASDDRKGAVDGVNIFSFYVNCIGAMLAMKEKARIAYLLRRSSPTPQPMAAIRNLPTSSWLSLSLRTLGILATNAYLKMHHFWCVPRVKNSLLTLNSPVSAWAVRNVLSVAPWGREAKAQQRASRMAPIKVDVKSTDT